jgi:hypothetical protein
LLLKKKTQKKKKKKKGGGMLTKGVMKCLSKSEKKDAFGLCWLGAPLSTIIIMDPAALIPY